MGGKRQALGTFLGVAGLVSRPAHAGQPPTVAVNPSPPYRVLYIEDDPQVSDLFTMTIRERGGKEH